MKPTQYLTELMLKILYQDDGIALGEFSNAVLDLRLYTLEKVFSDTDGVLNESPGVAANYSPISQAGIAIGFGNAPVSGASSTTITNNNNLAWPTVTGVGTPWGTIQSFGMADANAPGGPKLWFYLNLSSYVTPVPTTEVRIASGTLIPKLL